MYFVRVPYTFLNVTHYKLTHSHAVKKLKWFTPSVEQGSWENDFPAKGPFTNYIYKKRWVGSSVTSVVEFCGHESTGA